MARIDSLVKESNPTTWAAACCPTVGSFASDSDGVIDRSCSAHSTIRLNNYSEGFTAAVADSCRINSSVVGSSQKRLKKYVQALKDSAGSHLFAD